MKHLFGVFTLLVAILLPITTFAYDTPPIRVLSLVTHYAEEYGIHDEIPMMLATLKCESGWKSNAIGDSGRSYGISQIFLPAHPNITKEEALDAQFSIKFMSQEFAKDNQKIWTCWRQLNLSG